MKTLQSLTLPEIGLCTDELLYFRKSPLSLHSLSGHKIIIPKLECVDLFSYFNAFNVQKWGESSVPLDLWVRLVGRGKVLVKWIHHESLHFSHTLREDVCELSEEGVSIDLGIQVSNLSKGYVAPIVHALDDCVELMGLSYCTPTPAPRDVKLGIAITHFKREAQALGAVERLSSGLLKGEFASQAALTVIDNSQTLPAMDVPGVSIVKNKNYGGSGGFARGLLHYDLNGTFTHCLFMDDDASCHVESLKRAIRFLEFAKDDNTAVFGAMLYERAPHIQHESGAKFSNGCHPIGMGLNFHHRHCLFDNNSLPVPDYGGWWFFAFPIRKSLTYPFPFFVRGDDVSFCLTNKFALKTLNGICSWQENFENKVSPLTTYLDARSHLLHFLTGKTDGSSTDAVRTLRHFVDDKCMSQLYESAEAGLQALRDVMKGPDFWRENLDMAGKRSEISSFTKTEKAVSIKLSDLEKISTAREKGRKLKKFGRVFSANGVLLPTIFLRGRPVLQRRSFSADKDLTFRFKNILHYNDESELGYITTYSKVRQVGISVKKMCLVLKFKLMYKSLQADYLKAYPELASKEFWLNEYGQLKG